MEERKQEPTVVGREQDEGRRMPSVAGGGQEPERVEGDRGGLFGRKGQSGLSAVPSDDREQPAGVTASQWFLSICWLKIPVFGILYALVLAFVPGTDRTKKNFARGYLLYQILVLILAVTVAYVIYTLGLDLVDQVLSFVS